jgi:hypothetical protein
MAGRETRAFGIRAACQQWKSTMSLTEIDFRDDPYDPPLTPEHVRARVEDWLKRLDDLIGDIESWARAHGWTVERGTMPMHEHQMKLHDVPAREMPKLTMKSAAGRNVFVWPEALWVMGANGRVDIHSEKGYYVIIDIADEFQPPQWWLYKGAGDWSGREFVPALMAEMG